MPQQWLNGEKCQDECWMLKGGWIMQDQFINRLLCCSLPCVRQLVPGWMLNVEGWMNNARPVHQSTAVLQLTLCASVVARMNAECWRVDEYCKTSLFNRRLKPGVHAYVRDFPVVGTWRSVFRRDRVFWNEHKIWNAVTYWIAAATFNPFSATLIALLEEFPFKNILKYESQRR